MVLFIYLQQDWLNYLKPFTNELLQSLMLLKIREVLPPFFQPHSFLLQRQVIPSITSILAMLLREKFSVPESILLRYC